MAARIGEHPVLIPTSQGPAGGIVYEPARPRAAVMLLQTGGRSGRSGFSSEWALLSRRLAALGATVLRYDFWQEGDSSMITADRYPAGTDLPSNVSRDRALLRDVAGWFRGRTAGLDLIVVGACYGARLGVELAAESAAVSASLLVVPYLRPFNEDDRKRWRQRMLTVRAGGRAEEPGGDADEAPADRLDPIVSRVFEAALRHGSSWILIGERDAGEATALGAGLRERGLPLEVEVEPGAALYPGNDPDVQELVSDRVAARLDRLFGEDSKRVWPPPEKPAPRGSRSSP